MRTKMSLGITLIILIAIGIVMVPWVDGMMFKRQYYDFVKALEASEQAKIEILEYHQGWFSSDAKVSVLPTVNMSSGVPAAPNTPQTGSYTTPTIILEQHITHGPWVLDPVSNQKTFGLASIQSHVRLPATLEALLLGTQASSSGVVMINGMATFGGDFINQISTPVFNIRIPGIGQITWQGLNGSMNFHLVDQHIKNMTSNIVIGAVTARNDQAFSIATKDATVKYDLLADPSGLWSGFYSFLAPEISATLISAGNFLVKDINVSNTMKINPQDSYSSQFQIGLGQFVAPEFSITQSNINLSFENLKASALMNLINTINKQQSAMKPEEFQKQLDVLITPIITSQTMVKSNILINTSYGRLITAAQSSWPAPINRIFEITQKVKAQVDIRISITLLNQMIKELVELKSPKSLPMPESPVNTEPTEENLLKQIDTWSNQGSLDLSIGIQLKDLVQTHIPPADFGRNVDKFVQLKQLTPELAAQVKSQYQLVQDAANKPATVAIAKPQPASQVDVAMQQIANLVKQGYIKQDKDDYVTVITIENMTVKANGLDVNNLRNGSAGG